MKIGFWTLLDSEASWSTAQVAQEAAARGYHGADLRVARNDGRPTLGADVRLDSNPAVRERIRADFAAVGVEIASLNCYNGSPHSSSESSWRAFESELTRHAELATALGTRRVRFVIEGPAPDLDWPAYLRRGWARIGAALDRFPGLDAVVENHPGRANARQLFEVAEEIDDPRIGLEFSPEHALVMQEDVLGLIERYCRHIHHLCYADRRVVQEGLADFDGRYYTVRYESCWNGDGVVPTGRMLDLLRAGGFDDYISLKYEKSADYGWHLPPGIDALDHFPGFLAGFGIEPAPTCRQQS